MKWLCHYHIFKWYFEHPCHFVINHGCHVNGSLQWKNDVIIPITMLSSTNQMHHWYTTVTFFHIGFEIISYDYNKLCSRLKQLIIHFLIAKDKIHSSEIISLKWIVSHYHTLEQILLQNKILWFTFLHTPFYLFKVSGKWMDIEPFNTSGWQHN